MLGQIAYAADNESLQPADDRSGEDHASAMQLREELNEFLADTMHRLESLSDALMQCQVTAATEVASPSQKAPASNAAVADDDSAANNETGQDNEAQEASVAGVEPAPSPTANASAPSANIIHVEPAADPADRLAAIKLRLAKQIENA